MWRKKEEFKRCGILLKVTNLVRPSWPRFLILSHAHVPACVTGVKRALSPAALAAAVIRRIKKAFRIQPGRH